jgi:hypothetical protein
MVLWVEYASTFVLISFSAQFHPPNCVGSTRRAINMPIQAASRSTAPSLVRAARPDQFRAAFARATSKGWLLRHESGTYVKFAPTGAEIFA